MTLRKAILMLAVIVVAAVWIASHKVSAPPAEAPVTLGVSESALKQISIYTEGVGYRLLRRPEGWQIAALPQAQLDQKALQKLLQAVSSIRSERVLDTHPEEHETSFKHPPLRVELYSAERSKTLIFGALNPLSGRRYLRIAGDARLFLVDEIFFKALNVSQDDLRSRTPFHGVFAGAPQLTVRNQSGEWRIERLADNFKIVKDGHAFPAENENIAGALRSLEGIRAKRFIDNPSKDSSVYGLVHPLLTILFDKKHESESSFGPRTATISIDFGEVEVAEGGPAGADEAPLMPGRVFYARSSASSSIFELERPAYSSLLREPEQFRTRSLFLNAGIASLCLSDPEAQFAARREGERWLIAERCGGNTVKETASLPAVERLAAARAAAIVGKNTYFEPAGTELRIETADGGVWILTVGAELKTSGEAGSPAVSPGAGDGLTSAAPRLAKLTQPDGLVFILVLSGAEIEDFGSLKRLLQVNE